MSSPASGTPRSPPPPAAAASGARSPPPPSRDGPIRAEGLGLITQEYVSTPYGVGRLVLPFEPRDDGVVVVALEFGALYAPEAAIARLDGYEKQLKEQAAAERKRAKAATNGRDVSASPDSPVKRSLLPDVRLPDVRLPDFAPLNVPLYRRRQTLALAVTSFSALLFCVLSLLLVRAQGWPFYLFLAYLTYMFLFQDFHKNGRGLKSEWLRRSRWFCWFRDYFPISLHATAPLDPKGKYIFCYHPHGILSLGAFLNFGSEATGFSQKFPGIDLRLMTLTSNFKIPFYGIFLSMMGIADASRESCNATLNRGPGSSILLVLGGAKESLDAHPHTDYELTLHRKGFCKVALENGADLVPVFSFGENDIWDQADNPRGSRLRKLQERLQQKLGFALPVVKGRGIWQYNFGLLPHRRPITTIVGPPLRLPRVSPSEITDDLIDQVHSQYKEALLALFNRYKGTFAPHRRLIFVQPPLGSRGRRAQKQGTIGPVIPRD